MKIEDFFIKYLTPFFWVFIALLIKLISLIYSAIGDYSGFTILLYAPLPVVVLAIDLIMKGFVKKKELLFTIQLGILTLLFIAYLIYLLFN